VRVAQEPKAAHQLAQLLLEVAATTGNRAEAAVAFQARSVPLGADVHCVDEAELLSREGFLIRRRRFRKRGYVDLRLTDGRGFDLSVELKQKSATGREQIPDYVDRLAQRPLILVSNRFVDEPTLADNSNWLGTILWKDLLPGLHRVSQLPTWTTFLGVLEAELADASPYAERWRAALRESRTGLIDHVRAQLAARIGVRDGDHVAAWETKSVRRLSDGGWVRLRVPAAGREESAKIVIEVKGRTRTPRVRVYYLPRVPLIRTAQPVAPFERLVQDPAAAHIAAVAREGLAYFIERGVLDADARRTR
jgi:hypothetical protein